MPGPLEAVRRLREEMGVDFDMPLDAAEALAYICDVSVIPMERLSPRVIRDWLAGWQAEALVARVCTPAQSLCGAVLGWRGRGLIFVAAEDNEAERRYTAAHEAGHFVMDHRYPRQDAIHRLGAGIRGVVDGDRAATTDERFDAVLMQMNLDLHAHYLARSPDAAMLAAEFDADAFAFEALAPASAVAQRMTGRRPEIRELQCLLVEEFRLPPGPAKEYALLLSPPLHAPTLIERLGLA